MNAFSLSEVSGQLINWIDMHPKLWAASCCEAVEHKPFSGNFRYLTQTESLVSKISPPVLEPQQWFSNRLITTEEGGSHYTVFNWPSFIAQPPFIRPSVFEHRHLAMKNLRIHLGGLWPRALDPALQRLGIFHNSTWHTTGTQIFLE